MPACGREHGVIAHHVGGAYNRGVSEKMTVGVFQKITHGGVSKNYPWGCFKKLPVGVFQKNDRGGVSGDDPWGCLSTNNNALLH